MVKIQNHNILLIIGFISCLLLLGTSPQASEGLAINSSKLQTKSSTLSGQIEVTVAQWDFEFDQDLYYWSGPPCAAGLALPQFTQAAVDADPCWAGCNFAARGNACGRPFNSADASCQALCDAHPYREAICAETDWIEASVDEETPFYNISFGKPLNFRFNWLKVEQGFKLELMGFSAHLTVGGYPTWPAYLDSSYCYGANHPDPWTQLCPSSQCFTYGTHFVTVDFSPEGGINDYVGSFSFIIRSFKTPEGPRALTPPADVPATLPLQSTPYHVPIEFGVPVEAYFAPFQTLTAFQLTTFYCGMVVVQAEPSNWTRSVGRYAVGLSTNPLNPFPLDIFTDVIFVDGSSKAVFLCPSSPDTPAILYLIMARYTVGTDPALSNDELHYLTVDIPRNETDWRIYRFGSSPDNPPADPHPIPAIPSITEELYTKYAQFPLLLNFPDGLPANALTLICPDPKPDTTDTVSFNCRAGSSGIGTCFELLFVHPSDPYPSTLAPVPSTLTSLNEQLFSNINYGQPSVQSRALSFLLLLEYSFQRSSSQYTLGSDWESILPNCVVQLGTESPIGSIDGLWVQGTISPDQTFPTCELDEFNTMLDLMRQNLVALRANPSDALTQRTKTDLDTFQEPWQGCNRLVQNVLMNATYREVSVASTEICFDSDPTDPCCNSTGSWDGCCEARNVDTNISSWIQNEPSVNSICGNPTCVSPLLSDYAYQTSFDEVGGCLASLPDQTSGMEAYRQCLIDSFGEDYTTRSCVLDADCPGSDTYPGQIWCDQVTKTCAQNYTHFRDIFFECLASSLPSPIRIAMLERNNWVSQADNLASLLEQKFGNDPGCLTNAGSPWSENNWRLIYFQSTGCALIPYTSADPTRQIPPWADVRSGSSCTGVYWEPGSTLYLCGAETVCNWDPDSCNSAVTGTDFCGVCDTPSTCLEITGVSGESECEQQSVCFLADGTVRTDLTPQQCADTFTCTMTCNSGACTSADQCEAQGYCQFREGIQDAIAGSTATLGYQATGFCTKPMAANNDPDCSWIYPGSVPSSYGCVISANCTATTPFVCTANYLTETSCNSIGGTWHDQQTTKEACLADTACQTDNGLPSLSRIGNTLLTPKSTKDCSLCGGESVTLSTWMPGRWLPGVSRSPTWLPRQNVSTESLISNMIDFRSTFLEVYFSTIAALSFQLENNLQCTYSGVGFSVQTSVCDCTTTGSVDCYPLSDTLDIGRGRVCPNTTVIITAYPAILTAGQDALSSRLINECVSFELLRKPAVEFARLPAGQVTTGFVHRPPERSRESFDVVVNDNGAIVGQLVGDSVELRFSSSKEESKLQRLQVCLAPSSSIPQDLAKYPVYDLAYLSSSGKFVPLGFTFAFNGSYVCGNVSFVKNDIPRQFAPVLRTANYQNEPNPRLSDGEVALMYVIASLYAILFVLTMLQVIRLAWLGGFSFRTATNMLWLIFALMVCIRSVYFYLVAADVLGQPDQHELVDMWMIDLPTLLYLIGNLLIALSFLFLHLGTHDQALQRRHYFWMAALTLTLILVLIFVATLLAFNFVVVTEQGLTGPPLCPTYDDRSTQASIIRTVYEAVILFVSLVIALIGLVFSAAITRDLRRVDGSPIILRIGIVSSVGIMTDSLAFLIYYAINDPHPYFAIVLIFTEILPIFFIVAVLSSHQIRNQKNSLSFTRTSGGRGGSRAGSSAGSAGQRRESID